MANRFPKDDELCKVIGLNIKRLRKNRGLTQTELGEALGMSGHKPISDWEAGIPDIAVSQLKAAADFFEVTDWNEFKRTDWMESEEVD